MLMGGLIMNWENIKVIASIVIVSLISFLLYNLLPRWIYMLIVIALVLYFIIDWDKFSKKDHERDTEEKD